MENAKRTMKAAWLFPDILFLHGERGNIMALERIAGLFGDRSGSGKNRFFFRKI